MKLENMHHLGGALDQLEVHSMLFGPTTEKDSIKIKKIGAMKQIMPNDMVEVPLHFGTVETAF